jgi:hypothetical protein
MTGFVWWVWIVLAGILAWAELHIPGSYLVWIALGAGVTGVAAGLWELTLEGQIGAFAVASVMSCAGGYFVYRRVNREHRHETVLNERSRLLLGTRGVVCEALIDGQGKVRLGDGVWLAAGPDLPEGAPVVVTSVTGTRLTVEPLARAASQ